MWDQLVTAIALLLVIEGLLPFASPNLFRQGLEQMAQLGDNVLRLIGLASMLAGVVLLYLFR